MGVGDKTPKAVFTIREILKQKGLEIDPDAIKTLGHADKNLLGNAMRNALSSEVKMQYQQAKTDEERRAWLSAFLLDPKTCSCEGINSTRNVDRVLNRATAVWLTEEQLGSSAWLNSADHAKMMVTTLPERPHENEALASAGVKQYQYTYSKQGHDRVNEFETATTAKADLSADQYSQVQADMKGTDSSGVVTKKRKLNKEWKQETPEQKALRAAHGARAASLRNLKRELDRSNVEVRACENLISSMRSKGYPKAMEEWFLGQVQTFKDQHAEHHKYYVEAMGDIPATPWDEPRLTSSSAFLDSRVKMLQDHFKSFKEGASTDVKNLVSGRASSSSKAKK